jgi:hypothetical protein
MVDADTLVQVAMRLQEWRKDPWNPAYGKAGFPGVILSVLCDCGKGEYCPETGEQYKVIDAILTGA